MRVWFSFTKGSSSGASPFSGGEEAGGVGAEPTNDGGKRGRRQVVQATVRPLVIVRQTVVLGDHAGFSQAGEQFPVQKLVAKPTVERLAVRLQAPFSVAFSPTVSLARCTTF